MINPDTKRHLLPIDVNLILLDSLSSKVLLMKRTGTAWHSGTFGLPGGKHDRSEPLTVALQREVQEELGIVVEETDIRMGTSMHYFDPQDQFEALRFYFIANKYQGEIINKEPGKHTEIDFYPLNNLPESTTEHTITAIMNSINGILFTKYGW